MTTRIFHLSDVHFGVENRAALDEVARAIADEQPDIVVCTGDLTQRAKHSEYAAAGDWLESLDTAVWVDPGNHDMPYYNLVERFSDPFRRFRKFQQRVAVTEFETEDLVLVPLNTNVPAQRRWPWSDGVVTRQALEQTTLQLESLQPNDRFVIVTAHHPLHGPKMGGPSATIGGNSALSQLAHFGMDAIMTGHIHKPFNEFRSTHQTAPQVIGAGTLSTRLRHGAPPSYNVLTVERGADAIAVELRELPA